MSKVRVLELLPFVTLAAVAAILLSTLTASAGFAFPDLSDRFSFGSMSPAYRPDTTTTVQKAYMPFSDLSLLSGIEMPSGGFGMFRSPVTSERSYKQTVLTPDGPRTQITNQAYDGLTGERTTTVTNV
ncbi:MAG: hypothetical protein WBZ29_01955 [Methanocella sp.]